MTKRNPYLALERAVNAEDKDATKAAMAELTEYDKDLLVACMACGAAERKGCVGQPKKVVCFSRRLTRFLNGLR